MWPHICLSQHHGRRSREVAFRMCGKWVKQCLLGKEQGRDAGVEGRSLSHPRLLSDKGPAPVSVCYRGLSKLSRSNGSLEEHPPQRSLFWFPSGACRFLPVLTDSEPHCSSVCPGLCHKLPQLELKSKSEETPIFSDTAGEYAHKFISGPVGGR